MVEFQTMLRLQIELFLLMVAGYLAGKCKMVSRIGRKELSDIFLYIILPCNILSSFHNGLGRETLVQGVFVLIASFGIQVGCWGFSKLAYRGVEEGKRKVLSYSTQVSNAGFMGNPMVQGLYGAEGLLCSSLYLVPMRIFMWSVGLAQFTKVRGKDVVKKLLTHPCIIVVFVGLAEVMTGIYFPEVINKTISDVGNCVTAMSMILIGIILSDVDIKDVFSKILFRFAFIRLIMIPFCVFVVLKLLRVNSLLSGVCVVLAGMPAGSTTAILAEKYGADSEFASKVVLITTLLSMITLPIWCLVIKLY